MNVFQSVEQGARQRGLPFVVIGGLAVIQHGYSRLTTDFDLLVERTRKEPWHSLLLELGYELIHEAQAFSQYSAQQGPGWPIDLMFVNDSTFARMLAAAKPTTIGDALLQLVSLEHLLALKLHALKHSNLRRFLKDFEDVIHLVQLNKMDLRSPAIRDLFLKYGNEDLYGKILYACEND